MWMCKHETRARLGCAAMNCKGDLTQSRRGAELWQAMCGAGLASCRDLPLGHKANCNGLKPQMTQIHADEIRKLPCAITARAAAPALPAALCELRGSA